MEKKSDVLMQYTNSGFELLADNGKYLTFRKKFNTWAFILLLIFTFFGGIAYLIYHYNKKKMVVAYK